MSLRATVIDTRNRGSDNAHVVQMCYVHSVTSTAPEYTMSTTTIRLPDELKARIAVAAKRAGTTSHNFILEAIDAKADLAERRAVLDSSEERRVGERCGSTCRSRWAPDR